MEILGWQFLTENDEKDAEAFINESNVVALSDAIVETTIFIRKQIKIKLPDAIIAATALVNNFTLLTRNTDDFINIKGLNVINPML